MSTRVGIRFLGAALVAAALLVGGLAAPVGAATPAKVSAADCETLGNLGDNISTSGSGIFGRQAREISDGLDETAADIDDKKLKKALQTMADFYDELAGANSVIAATKISVREGRRYAKALKTFSKASLACVTTQMTLPPGVTLPSGVTLPTVPR